MPTGTFGRIKEVVSSKYFQKKNYKYEILNHLHFDPNFVFRGTALGRFSQCFFFLIFLRRPTMMAYIFTQPPAQPSNGRDTDSYIIEHTISN